MADKLTDEQIEAACQELVESGLGGPDSDVSLARQRNLEYYNAEPVGELAPPEIDDRSDFVATDVSDTIDGMLPQLMRMFTGSDDAVTFEGQGQPGSEQEAKLATAYVNHQFYVRNDGIGIIHDWFKDALNQKVGFAKVWAEEQPEDSRQKYEGQTPEQLAMLQVDGWQLAEDPQVDDNQLLTFTVVKESKRKAIKVEAVIPSEMRVDVNARWGGEPAAIGQVFERRRYELEQEGYDLSEVATVSGGAQADIQHLLELGETDDVRQGAIHGSHELVEFAELYVKLDRDGDGTAEWLKVCLVGGKLGIYEDGTTAIEQTDGHPYCWICPIPRPHAFFGDCPADRAIAPQKMRTRLVRSIDDNMAFVVNGRTYVNTRAAVNMDDLLDNRPGGVVRGEGAAGDALSPMVQPFLGAPAYQFNEYIASWAENRTGFNRYSAGTDQNALNKTARGTELLTAKADMRIELMARFFAVGMRQLFAKILKLAVQHQNVPEMVAINGQFVPINPGEFRNQYHVKINVGLGAGSKEQQSARILGLFQMQMQLQQAGLVRPQQLAETARLYVEANEFKNPERFVDAEPSGMPPNPQAFQQMQKQVQQQMSQLQQQLQQMAQENQSLKADQESKQANFAIKMREFDFKERELDMKAAQTTQQLNLNHRQEERTEAEFARGEDDSQAIAALQEQVAALTQVVIQLTQSSAMDGDMGMEAPTAPMEEGA